MAAGRERGAMRSNASPPRHELAIEQASVEVLRQQQRPARPLGDKHVVGDMIALDAPGRLDAARHGVVARRYRRELRNDCRLEDDVLEARLGWIGTEPGDG